MDIGAVVFFALLFGGGYWVLKKAGIKMPNLDIQEWRKKRIEKEIESLKKEKEMKKLEEKRDVLLKELEEMEETE